MREFQVVIDKRNLIFAVGDGAPADAGKHATEVVEKAIRVALNAAIEHLEREGIAYRRVERSLPEGFTAAICKGAKLTRRGRAAAAAMFANNHSEG